MKRKITSISLLITLLAIVSNLFSCSNSISSQEKVSNFGKNFVEKISNNQLDSLKILYPDIVLADSIVPVDSDTIIVNETASPEIFDVFLTNDVKLKVRLQGDNINVIESQGLFAYPEDKMRIARSTGLWEEDINDVQLSNRMKDDAFFDLIKQTKQLKPSDIISVGKLVVTKEWSGYATDQGEGYYLLTNNTDSPISGEDYQIIYDVEIMNAGITTTENEKGIDLPPHGSAKLNISFRPNYDKSFKKIKFTLSDEELNSRFNKFTGNEYQEYLESKKKK